jgi:hypothetical protein
LHVYMDGSVFALALLLTSTLSGCAYRLPPVTLLTQVRLKVIAKSPDVYGARLRIAEPPREYRFSSDGHVRLDVPAYRAACGVYLFGKLKMPNHADPYTLNLVDLLAGDKTVRQLSLKKISALPVDADGYHVLIAPATR